MQCVRKVVSFLIFYIRPCLSKVSTSLDLHCLIIWCILRAQELMNFNNDIMLRISHAKCLNIYDFHF